MSQTKGKKVMLSESHPEIAAEWHPTKNGDLTPDTISWGSSKKVWWKCKNGHEWQSIVFNRTKGSGCPVCAGKAVLPGYNDLASVMPELVEGWHPTKNGSLKPDAVTIGSNKKAWWICPEGHEWQVRIADRVKGRGCPVCAGKDVVAGFNDLASLNPELTSQWHPTKNGELTPEQVSPGSNRKIWWICSEGHSWQARVANRNRGSGCPVCAGRNPRDHTLVLTRPEIAAEWHPTKNGSLTPDMVTSGANKMVWWVCPEGHEWQGRVVDRSNGRGCPVCAGKRVLVGYNDLATVRPHLVPEWHPTKNGDLTPYDVTCGSSRKVWWKCEMGHEWEAKIAMRSVGTGCPICANRGRRKKRKKDNDK